MKSEIKYRLIMSMILFLMTLLIGSYSLSNNRQFKFMGGMAEEYFELGLNLTQLGRFHPDENIAYVFRPPGYSFFIAATIKLSQIFPLNSPASSAIRQVINQEELHRAVYYAQCLLLSLTTVIFFIWMSTCLSMSNAFFTSLLFALNPYFHILTGLIHYEILHIFLTILSCFVLSWAIRHKNGFTIKIIIAGALWGVTTLVRPMTMILPAFVLIVALIHFRPAVKKALKATFLFIFGMIIVISPYTIHNYCRTGSFIPINSQGGAALWLASVAKLDKNPNQYNFWRLIKKQKAISQINEVWHQVEGIKPPLNPILNFNIYIQNSVEFDHAFKDMAIKNIMQRPNVYTYNFLNNLKTYNCDINSILIKLFETIQNPYINVKYKNWLSSGIPQEYNYSDMDNGFEYLIYLLSIFGLAGIVNSIVNKDTFLFVPLAVFLCFGFSHAITYMDLMYYYIKVPFLYFFSGYFIAKLRCFKLNTKKIPFNLPLDYILNTALLTYSIILISYVVI